MRAPEVARWQLKYRVGWDATGTSANSVGNVDGDVKIQWQSKGGGSRSGSLGSGPGEGLRACHPSGGLGLGDTLQLPEEDPCGCFAVFSSTRGGCSLKDVWRSRSEPSRPCCQDPCGVARRW